MSETWQRVASLARLEPEYPTRVKIGSRELALYLIDGAVFATGNICTHAFAQLSDGHVEGFQVFCPLHNGSFDVRTGAPMSEPCESPIEVFECRVEGDTVLVKIAADE
jgi:nitrite reductase/ring-hydroxylating ferredoxin subunit